VPVVRALVADLRSWIARPVALPSPQRPAPGPPPEQWSPLAFRQLWSTQISGHENGTAWVSCETTALSPGEQW